MFLPRYPEKSNKSKSIARTLRKNMTKEERHLWYDFLKGYSPSFRRQYVILEYIVDFFCPSARLAIELDGSQHYEPETALKDRLRTERIEEYGIEIVRYTNLDIQKRFDEVCEDIDERVKHILKQE